MSQRLEAALRSVRAQVESLRFAAPDMQWVWFGEIESTILAALEEQEAAPPEAPDDTNRVVLHGVAGNPSDPDVDGSAPGRRSIADTAWLLATAGRYMNHANYCRWFEECTCGLAEWRRRLAAAAPQGEPEPTSLAELFHPHTCLWCGSTEHWGTDDCPTANPRCAECGGPLMRVEGSGRWQCVNCLLYVAAAPLGEGNTDE